MILNNCKTLRSLFDLEYLDFNYKRNTLRCGKDLFNEYPRNMLCVYDIGKSGSLNTCKSGQLLQDCGMTVFS